MYGMQTLMPLVNENTKTSLLIIPQNSSQSNPKISNVDDMNEWEKVNEAGTNNAIKLSAGTSQTKLININTVTGGPVNTDHLHSHLKKRTITNSAKMYLKKHPPVLIRTVLIKGTTDDSLSKYSYNSTSPINKTQKMITDSPIKLLNAPGILRTNKVKKINNSPDTSPGLLIKSKEVTTNNDITRILSHVVNQGTTDYPLFKSDIHTAHPTQHHMRLPLKSFAYPLPKVIQDLIHSINEAKRRKLILQNYPHYIGPPPPMLITRAGESHKGVLSKLATRQPMAMNGTSNFQAEKLTLHNSQAKIGNHPLTLIHQKGEPRSTNALNVHNLQSIIIKNPPVLTPKRGGSHNEFVPKSASTQPMIIGDKEKTTTSAFDISMKIFTNRPPVLILDDTGGYMELPSSQPVITSGREKTQVLSVIISLKEIVILK